MFGHAVIRVAINNRKAPLLSLQVNFQASYTACTYHLFQKALTYLEIEFQSNFGNTTTSIKSNQICREMQNRFSRKYNNFFAQKSESLLQCNIEIVYHLFQFFKV